MANEPHVAAVCGSLRDESVTRVALEGVEQAGGEGQLLDLREYDLPAFDPDVDDEDAGDAAELARQVREADAIVLGTPMYHGSYSSNLKTALEHLRSVCRALDAWVLPYQAAVPRSHSAVRDGTFTDEELEERVVELGREVTQYANIEPSPPSMESEENVGAVD
jgi:NAD(P)H-dependent FMN reductase